MAPAMTRDPEGDDRPPLRIAVIGTPRSGNTRLRAMLAASYGLEQGSTHTPDQADRNRPGLQLGSTRDDRDPGPSDGPSSGTDSCKT